MVNPLQAAVVITDVVLGPADAELLALGRELADQIGEVAVVRIATRFAAQDGDGVVRDPFPIDEERRRAWVEEGEARLSSTGRRGFANSSE